MEVKSLKIKESAENYLETILILKIRNGEVRSIDIAKELNFTRPSVSNAMKNLRKHDYIQVNKDGYIDLTDKGLDIANSIYERHILLSKYLIALGVNEKIAKKDACRIEHVISEESFLQIKKHLETFDELGI